MLTAIAIPLVAGKWSSMLGSGTAENAICAVALPGPHVAMLKNLKNGTAEIVTGGRDKDLLNFVPYHDPASRVAVQRSRDVSPQQLHNSLRRVCEVRAEK